MLRAMVTYLLENGQIKTQFKRPRDPEIRPSKGQGRSELQKGTGIL